MFSRKKLILLNIIDIQVTEAIQSERTMKTVPNVPFVIFAEI